MTESKRDVVARLRGAAADPVNRREKELIAEAADSIEELRFWLQRSQARERELRDQLANTQPMPFDDNQ
jgi:hypothetical protein